MPVVIDLEDKWERMKWTCPRGHRTWEPTNHHLWCQACSNAWDVDPSFDELHNAQTGETYHRNEVVLQDSAGTYTNPTTP